MNGFERSLDLSITREMRKLKTQFKTILGSPSAVDEYKTTENEFFKIAKMASGVDLTNDGFSFIIDLKRKLYQFDFYSNGRYRLKSGYHIGYIESLKFCVSNNNEISNVYCIGYHMNASPFSLDCYDPDRDRVASFVFAKNRNNDDVIDILADKHLFRWTCTGIYTRAQLTYMNVMNIIGILETPHAHTESFYSIPRLLCEKVCTWGSDSNEVDHEEDWPNMSDEYSYFTEEEEEEDYDE